MGLHHRFSDRSAFAPGTGYRLLPFRFARFDARRYIATNDVGEYVLLTRDELAAFAARRLPHGTPLYRSLKSKHFLFDDDSRVALDLLALKVRTRAETVANLTGLHIFVVTLRCDHSCQYCQVSRQTEDRTAYDMKPAHADRALELAFASPSPSIKVEFQGGEPLLNFGLIRHVVERATEINAAHGKDLQFVIASNLTRLSDEILDFCAEHRVFFSTSLDGPRDLHDAQRPLKGGSSHHATVDGIARIRARLGADAVSALMTTTPASLHRVEEIIDEYVKHGFRSVFLRSLSPYGFAAKSLVRRYSVHDWVAFYKRGLAHVLELNRRGTPFREEFTAILLHKMVSPSGTGYVDLQSPAGLGIGALVYNYDGAIYASDEGRMLAEMDDQEFRLGHLDDAESFAALVTGEALVSVLDATLLESAPMCSDCPFLPFCGADPAFHKATLGDVVGHKALSAFCTKQMEVLAHLIGLLEDDPSARDTLLGWI